MPNTKWRHAETVYFLFALNNLLKEPFYIYRSLITISYCSIFHIMPFNANALFKNSFVT